MVCVCVEREGRESPKGCFVSKKIKTTSPLSTQVRGGGGGGGH